MDMTPIIILDFIKLEEMIDNQEIDPPAYCNLFNFLATYIQGNMQVPGCVEKWLSITNVRSFPLKKLTVAFFKYIANECGCNYVESATKQVITNLTWVQNVLATMLQKFLDPETVACQIFSNRPDPEELLAFVYPSQLETIFGGTAPKVERFWPPTMPPMTEQRDERALNMVPK